MMGFEGVIVPMLTPFGRKGKVNLDKAGELVEFLIDGGVSGLFPSSSIGEASSMSVEERKRVIQYVIDRTNGRLPVIPGTGSSDITGTVELTRFAQDAGADGVIVVTPYYLKPDQEGLRDYFVEVAGSVDIPIFLYQIPMATGVEISADTVARLSHEVGNIVGMKDSSGNMARVMEMKRRCPKDFAIFQGWDTLLLPSLEMGCAGGMVGTPNIAPRYAVDLFRAFKAGDGEEAYRIQMEMLGPLFEACMGAGVFPAGFKEASRLLGVDVGPPRRPIRPLTGAERSRLVSRLRGLGLLPTQ